MDAPTHLVVGHVARPHGTGGEVLVTPLTDYAESVFAEESVLWASSDDGRSPHPDLPPLRVVAVRFVNRGLLVAFGGVETRDEAERLRGLYLMRPLAELPGLEEGELFYHQLMGMRVETTAGEAVGVVQEVYELEPAHLLEVRGEERTVLVPFSSQIVRRVDPDEGRVVIDPPDGLLDL